MADVVKEKLALLRAKLDQIPALEQAEVSFETSHCDSPLLLDGESHLAYCSTQAATKVPKEYLVIGGGGIFTLLIFFGVGAGVLCSIVGFVYPAFKSFETIETKTKGDDIQWLVYWVIFAFFSLIETFKDFLLYWIPFYYAFKLAFLLWAMLPQTKGSKFLYDSFLKDFLKKSESRIDAAMAESRKVCFVLESWFLAHLRIF